METYIMLMNHWKNVDGKWFNLNKFNKIYVISDYDKYSINATDGDGDCWYVKEDFNSQSEAQTFLNNLFIDS